MQYGTNTRDLMDALSIVGLKVKELDVREAVGEARTVRLVAIISDGYYTYDREPSKSVQPDPCKACDGTGKVGKIDEITGEMSNARTEKCPACDGTGLAKYLWRCPSTIHGTPKKGV